MSRLTIVEVEERYHQLVAQGAYEEALILVTNEADQFSQFSYHAEKVVYYWRFRMAALLHKPDLVLQLLSEAVAKGHWFSGLAKNKELELVHTSPEFMRLTKICDARRKEAMETAVPVLKTIQPENHTPPHPLLLALHGNNSRVDEFGEHWKTAVSHGWLIGLPQSSQSYEPDTASWIDWEWSIQEVQQHYATLCQEYPVDVQQTVLAGFSIGGGLAAHLALSGKIKPKAMILVAPFLNNAKSVLPYLEAGSFPGNMIVYLAASERDAYCRDIAQKLASYFAQFKIAHHIEIFPDLEHSFPPQLTTKLPELLSMITQ